MGADPTRQEPFFFGKPADAVVCSGRNLKFPSHTNNLHHEVELVIALGEGGRNIPPERVADLIFGSAVGLDLTRRDLQNLAKQAGRPWDMSKGFDESAPIGAVSPDTLPTHGAVVLTIDGEVRQRGAIEQMIWSPAEIVSKLSSFVTLLAGDLIFTGTPSGVGPILPGQRVRGAIDGLEPVDVMFERP